jgi:hypothetical protein
VLQGGESLPDGGRHSYGTPPCRFFSNLDRHGSTAVSRAAGSPGMASFSHWTRSVGAQLALPPIVSQHTAAPLPRR